MINWMYFPKNKPLDVVSQQVVKAFQDIASEVDSETHHYKSDEVLAVVRPGLESINFTVEKSKRSEDLVAVPVLYTISTMSATSIRRNGTLKTGGWAKGQELKNRLLLVVRTA